MSLSLDELLFVLQDFPVHPTGRTLSGLQGVMGADQVGACINGGLARRVAESLDGLGIF